MALCHTKNSEAACNVRENLANPATFHKTI